jgi:hypothetical protein
MQLYLFSLLTLVGTTISWRLTIGVSGCRGTHQGYSSGKDFQRHTFLLNAG